MRSDRTTQFTGEMEFKNHLQSIKATLVNYTSVAELESYIPEFCAITWLEDIKQTERFLKSRGMNRQDMVMEMFHYRTLPTALETVGLTFFLEGLDLTNVTHIIRHRLFSFSAQSTDPTSMEGHDILENDAFTADPELHERAVKLCEMANELYIDALNKGLSFYDARHYQVRAKEAKYFMSGNIKDFVSFVNTRLGRTNQPTSDNILALRIRQQILEVYPFLEYQMPVEKIQNHYISAINCKMNMNTFPPDALHREELHKRGIDWSDAKFNHPKPREESYHMRKFNKLVEEITK